MLKSFAYMDQRGYNQELFPPKVIPKILTLHIAGLHKADEQICGNAELKKATVHDQTTPLGAVWSWTIMFHSLQMLFLPG